MRLLCPHCQKVISVSDAEAGKAVQCPECQKAFQSPSLFVPEASAPVYALSSEPVPAPRAQTVAPPAPGSFPSLEMPSPKAPRVAKEASPTDAFSDGMKFHGFPISADVCRWVVRVGLSLALLLAFLPWVKSAPLGHTAYSQNAWQCLFAGLSVDAVAEETFHWEKPLREHLPGNVWLFPFGLALTAAALLAWADIALAKWKPKLPPLIEKILTERELALSIATGLALLFLIVQSAAGLGLDTAGLRAASAETAELQGAATTPEKAKIAELTTGHKWAGYQIQTTFWFGLTRLCLLSAAVAVGLLAVLGRRGSRPAPRIGAMY